MYIKKFKLVFAQWLKLYHNDYLLYNLGKTYMNRIYLYKKNELFLIFFYNSVTEVKNHKTQKRNLVDKQRRIEVFCLCLGIYLILFDRIFINLSQNQSLMRSITQKFYHM